MAKSDLIIKTPRGAIVSQTNKNGKINARFEWNSDFAAKQTNNFNNAQKFVDSEVLRMCEPYVPMQTGMLLDSSTLGTVIGTGEVEWIAPYAAMQYYETAETRDYGALRGGKWFERMKADHGKQIIASAKKIAGGSR